LENYSWPGNIRELENLIERAVITSHEPNLQINLPNHLPVDNNKNKTLETIDREYMKNILVKCNWKIKGANGAAEILGLKPSTLRDRMKKLNIKRPASSN
jgi:formate hydrogenlyase transcriptional activator